MSNIYSIYNIYNNINIINYLFILLLHSLRSLSHARSFMLVRSSRAQNFENIDVNVHRVGPIRKKSSTIFKTPLEFSKIFYNNFQKGSNYRD